MQNNDKEKAKLYEVAVEKLISVVHECLGKPRSSREEDSMRKCEISPTGYVGLCIGKVETKQTTVWNMMVNIFITLINGYWHWHVQIMSRRGYVLVKVSSHTFSRIVDIVRSVAYDGSYQLVSIAVCLCHVRNPIASILTFCSLCTHLYPN